MEREKRKKMSPEENGGGVVEETKKKKQKKTRKEERETTPAEVEVEEPTTEEVEEFYAILRRMDVALRYLKGTQRRLRERRTAPETAVVTIGEVGENKELNLNEVPADSTN